MKCGSSKHQARDCKALPRAKTSPFASNTYQVLVQKQSIFDKVHFKIINLGSDHTWGNK